MALFQFVVALGLMSATVDATPDNSLMSYDFLYREGAEKYLEEDWGECIRFMELALLDWHWWRNNLIACRRECDMKDINDELFSSKLPLPSEEERFFEKAVRSTLCLTKCKEKAFGRSRIERLIEGEVDDDFEMRKPYEYLQICYYKVNKYKDAADAAATVLAYQPSNEVVQTNLQHYIDDGELTRENIVNRELQEYGKLYILGNIEYNEQNYKKTIENMEESLNYYYGSYEDCRRLCEKPFDQGLYPDFIVSLANHYTFTLRCKTKCSAQLSNLYGTPVDDMYASYFNYLQYSYFKVGNLPKACQAVASALFLDPEDAVQLKNKNYYLYKEDGVTEALFVPREDVIEHKKMLDYEKSIVTYIDTSFIYLEDYGEDYIEDNTSNVEGEGGGGGNVTDAKTAINKDGSNSSSIILELEKEEL